MVAVTELLAEGVSRGKNPVPVCRFKEVSKAANYQLLRGCPESAVFITFFRVAYSPVNVGNLEIFTAGTEVTPEMLFEIGLTDSRTRPVKILADGEIKNALTVKAHKFSEAAKAKIEAAGGKVEEI